MTFIQVVILIVASVSVLIWITIRQDQKKTAQQRRENKIIASTIEKIEKEKNFEKSLKKSDQEKIKKFMSENKEGEKWLIYIAIIIGNSIYFYKIFTEPNFTLGIFGYILLTGFFIIIVETLQNNFLDFSLKGKENFQKNKKDINNKNINLQYSTNSFDDFIAGRMSLAKCFWFYHVLIGFVLGFLCAYFAEVYQQYWLYIFPIAYYAVVTVAVWNCSTLYAKDRLENKQPYGWAIAAKIVVVLNAVGLIGQTIIMLSAK